MSTGVQEDLLNVHEGSDPEFTSCVGLKKEEAQHQRIQRLLWSPRGSLMKAHRGVPEIPRRRFELEVTVTLI